MLWQIKVGLLVALIVGSFVGGCEWKDRAWVAKLAEAKEKAEIGVREKHATRLDGEEADDADFASALAGIPAATTSTLLEIPHANLRPKPQIIYVEGKPAECPVVSSLTPDLVRLFNRGRVPQADPAGAAGRDGDGSVRGGSDGHP